MRPGADLNALRARDSLYKTLRTFFAGRGFLEVDVPVLSRAGATDPHIQSFSTQFPVDDKSGERLYLHTSPEFAMKRLLADGSGPIYSLAKVFRYAESGRHHNPEFTLLEWYQPGLDDQGLMDQVAELLEPLLSLETEKLSYRHAFQRYLGINCFSATTEALIARARQQLDIDLDDADRDTWLELLFSHLIQPQLSGKLYFVYDYPASQCALAKITDDSGEPVARRFEVFAKGVELGNGYWELTDAEEQRQRFEADNAKRRHMGLAPVPIDENLLAAMDQGLPDCAGVALGIDRLLMIMLEKDRLDGVISFTLDRC